MSDHRTIDVMSKGLSHVIRYDACDDSLISEHRWSIGETGKIRKLYYAVTTIPVSGQQTWIRMHRLLLGLSPGDGVQVDHLNHDGLDNRRANLRTVTHRQNRANARGWINGSSVHLGVSWNRRRRKWQAAVDSEYLGLFTDEAEAAAACKAAAISRFGEFANTGVQE